jgi:hypothetical protein
MRERLELLITRIRADSLVTDQWIARGITVVGFIVSAIASAIAPGHPIAVILLLSLSALLFIVALWVAARDRIRSFFV